MRPWPSQVVQVRGLEPRRAPVPEQVLHTILLGTSISAVTECDLFLMFRTQFSDSRPMPRKSSCVVPLISTGRPAVSGFIFSITRSSIGKTL